MASSTAALMTAMSDSSADQSSLRMPTSRAGTGAGAGANNNTAHAPHNASTTFAAGLTFGSLADSFHSEDYDDNAPMLRPAPAVASGDEPPRRAPPTQRHLESLAEESSNDASSGTSMTRDDITRGDARENASTRAALDLARNDASGVSSNALHDDSEDDYGAGAQRGGRGNNGRTSRPAGAVLKDLNLNGSAPTGAEARRAAGRARKMPGSGAAQTMTLRDQEQVRVSLPRLASTPL